MIEFNGFRWKDISSEKMGLIVDKLPPITRAEERVEKKIVQGRDGHLTFSDGTFESYTKQVEFHVDNREIDTLSSWLCGSGQVVFGNQGDRYYKARIINQIDFNYILPILHKGIVIFDVQPFGYLFEGEKTITITRNNSEILGLGTYPSKPYFKVYGNGDITLTVNSNDVLIKGVNGYVEIDTELDIFYKDTTSMEDKVTGNCPTLLPSINNISWVGNVTKVEIIPRWCSL